MRLFLAIFFGINVLANGYIFWRLFSYFHWKTGLLFGLLIVSFSISYIAAAWLDRMDGFFLSRWLLHLAGLWLGVGLILLVCIAVGDAVRLAVPIPLEISRWLVLGAAAILIVYSLANARRIEVVEVTLPASVDKTIVHLSDFHVGSVSPAHLRRVVNLTRAAHPDLVLMTGDLMDPYSGLSDESFASLKEIQVPIYFTIGNHERYAGLDTVMERIRQTPLIPLRNETAELDGIQLIGIDDSENPEQVKTRLDKMVIDNERYTVLMYHRPIGFEAAVEKGIDLMLCGHTHNGQIFPFNYVVKSRFAQTKGVYKSGQHTLVVSTGSGTWGPPKRVGSRNQVIVIKLQKTPDD
jgi:predicted MPP superfamily phosphohydrolase